MFSSTKNMNKKKKNEERKKKLKKLLEEWLQIQKSIISLWLSNHFEFGKLHSEKNKGKSDKRKKKKTLHLLKSREKKWLEDQQERATF